MTAKKMLQLDKRVTKIVDDLHEKVAIKKHIGRRICRAGIGEKSVSK